jgi:hypothetical protein
LAAGALLAGLTSATAVQAASAPTPVAAVSLAGYNGLKQGVAYAGKLSGNPDLAVGLETILNLVTQGRGLDGLDKARPWGVVFLLDEDKVASGERRPDQFLSAYAFLPVDDVKKLQETFALLGGAVKDVGNGVVELQGKDTLNKRPLFAKSAGKWLYLSLKAEWLGSVAENPQRLLGKMPEQYLAAVRVDLAKLPSVFRKKFLDEFSRHLESELPKKPGETDEQHASRKTILEAMRHYVPETVNDLESATLGLKIDPKQGNASLAFDLLASEGSQAATAASMLSNTTTSFRGLLLSNATASVKATLKTSSIYSAELDSIFDNATKQALAEIDQKEKNADKAKAAKEFTSQLLAIIRKTVVSGQWDAAGAMVGGKETLTAVAGVRVADGADVQKLFDGVVNAAKKENAAMVDLLLKKDVAKVDDVAFHQLSLPIPPEAKNREETVKRLGEQVDVVFGIGSDAVYVAVGRNALATLKSAISNSKTPKSTAETAAQPTEPMVQATVALRTLADLGSSLKANPVFGGLLSILRDAKEKDHVQASLIPVDRGIRLQVTAEDDVLAILAKALQGQALKK